MPHDAPTADRDPAFRALWRDAGLAEDAPARLALEGGDPVLPSSFAVARAAQLSIAAAALAATEVGRLRNGVEQTVAVAARAAALECCGHFAVDGRTPDLWDPIAGLYPCADADGIHAGWIRIHTNFPHHRDALLRLVGLPPGPATTRDAVAAAIATRTSLALEEEAMRSGCVVAALRDAATWRRHPQAAATSALPVVEIRRLGDAPARADPVLPAAARPLAGIRVLEMTRILAGPVAGRTLAAHGADVLLVNSPRLPNIEAIADTSRGKRSAHADLDDPDDRSRLHDRLDEADVFLHSYRPGSLDRHGLDPATLAAAHPGIVAASISAWGRLGPWAGRRGFDSLVQTATGFNVDEGEAAGAAKPLPLPLQILDMAGGHLLAFGIAAALWRQRIEGGSWQVEVSLVRTGDWLRSLGRVDGGLATPKPSFPAEAMLETDSGFGRLLVSRHAARLSATPPGHDRPSVPPGHDALRW